MRLSRRNLFRLGILGVVGLLGGYGYYRGLSPQLEQVDIKLDLLPASFNGLKIVQLSDMHSSRLTSEDIIRKGVDLALECRPDIVALTGDFITASSLFAWGKIGGFKKSDLDRCLNALSRLSAPMGIYAVLGNHDVWSGKAETEKIVEGLKDIGVRVLRNESVILEKNGERIGLAGVDDYWASTFNLKRAVEGLPPGVAILLSHNPDINEQINLVDRQVDFILSGHTHGGQVVLPFIGAPFLPSPFGQKYRAGLVRDQNHQTYVSRGLGLYLAPIRLNCPPEVTCFKLRRT